MSETTPQNTMSATAALHLRFGWWTLLFFLSLGLVLEALHGFKVGSYLDVSNASRRLMWTLAHAHGTLLALVNLAFAFTLNQLSAWPPGPRKMASRTLLAASLLMPGGFFLGGLVIYGGDPGPGIVLVALGGLLLVVAVLLIARGCESVVEADDKRSVKKAGGRGKNPKK
jgi:hypothetical protein